MSEKNVNLVKLMLEVETVASELGIAGASAKEISRYAHFCAIIAHTTIVLSYSESLEPAERRSLNARLERAEMGKLQLISEIKLRSLDQRAQTTDLVVFPRHQA